MQTDENRIDFELKKDLLVSDYRTYFDSATRSLGAITTLRQWEITLVVAILSYAASQGKVHLFPIPTFAVLFFFAILELAVRGDLRLTYKGALEVERLFKEGENPLITLQGYDFGNTKKASITFGQKIKSVLIGIVNPDFLVWNVCALALCVVVFGPF